MLHKAGTTQNTTRSKYNHEISKKMESIINSYVYRTITSLTASMNSHYFYCTPLTSQHWSGVMDYMSTSMLTTLQYSVYGFCSLLSTDQLQSSMSACIDDVAGWMASNRLLSNASKTEIMWCSSVRRQS